MIFMIFGQKTVRNQRIWKGIGNVLN